MRHSIVVMLPVLPLIGPTCSADLPIDSALAVRDSSGVEIVENLAPCWTSSIGWRLSAEPVITIGTSEGDPGHELYRVTGAHRLRNGHIVVANRSTYELRFFDEAGTYLHSAGGQGGGPGEFERTISLFADPRDSLVVYESNRLSVFDTDGQYARSYPMPSLDQPGTLSVVGIFGDGSILIGLQTYTAYTETGLKVDSISYYRTSPRGEVVDTVGVFFSNHTFLQMLENGLIALPLPFGRDGTVQVTNATIVYGSTEKYEFHVLSPAGQSLRVIRLARESPSLTGAILDSLRRDRLSRADTDLEVARAEMMVEATSDFTTLPAYETFTVDQTGNIWVLEPSLPNAAWRQWVVFNREGRCLGTVDTPKGLTVFEIGHEYVLGEAVDTMGVERIEMWGIEKGSYPP